MVYLSYPTLCRSTKMYIEVSSTAAGSSGPDLVEIILRHWALGWANDDADLDEESHFCWEHKENKGL